MRRTRVGLATAALAVSAAVFGFGAPASAASGTCTADGDAAPYLSGGSLHGSASIHCTATAKFTLTGKLWRNNGDGTYSSFGTITVNQTDNGSWSVDPTVSCPGGSLRQWHTESAITWAIYNGSTRVAHGSSTDNSPDVNLVCR